MNRRTPQTMRGAATMDLDYCPLCLSTQASGKEISSGFSGRCGERSVEVVAGIPTVTRVTCPECEGAYEITDDAIFFLESRDGMRKRAVEDIRRWGFKEIPTITAQWLQEMWEPGEDD
jgi:hypothetical protein